MALAACGDDDDAGGASPVETETDADTGETDPAPVEVTLVDYAFEGLPATVDATVEASTMWIQFLCPGRVTPRTRSRPQACDLGFRAL